MYKDLKNILWKCITCNKKNQKTVAPYISIDKIQDTKNCWWEDWKDDNKRFLLNLLHTLCCKKKCRKKRRKMNEDWLSIQTKNVRFYSSIFCYTFFSYLPSYYLSKTFIQSGTVATPYLYNMIYKKNINTEFAVDYSLEQITYMFSIYYSETKLKKIKQN